jgi:hypothetical protein
VRRTISNGIGKVATISEAGSRFDAASDARDRSNDSLVREFAASGRVESVCARFKVIFILGFYTRILSNERYVTYCIVLQTLSVNRFMKQSFCGYRVLFLDSFLLFNLMFIYVLRLENVSAIDIFIMNFA